LLLCKVAAAGESLITARHVPSMGNGRDWQASGGLRVSVPLPHAGSDDEESGEVRSDRFLHNGPAGTMRLVDLFFSLALALIVRFYRRPPTVDVA
jgi:hypothetical protein